MCEIVKGKKLADCGRCSCNASDQRGQHEWAPNGTVKRKWRGEVYEVDRYKCVNSGCYATKTA